jgi:hypothetical protein
MSASADDGTMPSHARSVSCWTNRSPCPVHTCRPTPRPPERGEEVRRPGRLQGKKGKSDDLAHFYRERRRHCDGRDEIVALRRSDRGADGIGPAVDRRRADGRRHVVAGSLHDGQRGLDGCAGSGGGRLIRRGTHEHVHPRPDRPAAPAKAGVAAGGPGAHADGGARHGDDRWGGLLGAATGQCDPPRHRARKPDSPSIVCAGHAGRVPAGGHGAAPARAGDGGTRDHREAAR